MAKLGIEYRFEYPAGQQGPFDGIRRLPGFKHLLDRLNEAVSAIRGEKSRVEEAWQHAVEAQRADRDLHDNYLSATLAALTEIRPMISALEERLAAKDRAAAERHNESSASVPPARFRASSTFLSEASSRSS